jgi:hypothetical protein
MTAWAKAAAPASSSREQKRSGRGQSCQWRGRARPCMCARASAVDACVQSRRNATGRPVDPSMERRRNSGAGRPRCRRGARGPGTSPWWMRSSMTGRRGRSRRGCRHAEELCGRAVKLAWELRVPVTLGGRTERTGTARPQWDAHSQARYCKVAAGPKERRAVGAAGRCCASWRVGAEPRSGVQGA